MENELKSEIKEEKVKFEEKFSKMEQKFDNLAQNFELLSKNLDTLHKANRNNENLDFFIQLQDKNREQIAKNFNATLLKMELKNLELESEN